MPKLQQPETGFHRSQRRGPRRSKRRDASRHAAGDAFQPSTTQWQASGARWRVSRHSARLILLAVLVSLFALSMIEMMSRIPRFQAASSQKLTNSDFMHGLQGWSGSAFQPRGMQLVYAAGTSPRSAQIRQHLDLAPGYYRISVEVSAARTAMLSAVRPRAQLELTSAKQRGRAANRVDVGLRRNGGWWPLSELVYVNARGADFRVVFSGSGTFAMRNPRVVQLVELGSYRLAKGLFVALLSIALVGVMWLAWRYRQHLRQLIQHPDRSRDLLLLAAPVSIAVLAALVPARVLTSTLYPLVPDGLLNVVSTLPGNALSQPSDLGHLLAFALIGSIIAWRYRGSAIIAPMMMICALALMIEALQTLTSDRTASYLDVAVDAAGLLAGLLISAVIRGVFDWRDQFARRRQTEPAPPPTFKFNSVDRQNYDIATPVVKRRRRRKAAEPVD